MSWSLGTPEHHSAGHGASYQYRIGEREETTILTTSEHPCGSLLEVPKLRAVYIESSSGSGCEVDGLDNRVELKGDEWEDAEPEIVLEVEICDKE